MIGLVLSLLGRWGVPERVRKPVACIGGAVLALMLLWGAKALYDRSVIREHEAERAARTIEARDDAADERATDTIRNTQSEKELHDAIDAAPEGGALSPAARALACERLRKLGRVPPACGPQGSDGGEAGTGR